MINEVVWINFTNLRDNGIPAIPRIKARISPKTHEKDTRAYLFELAKHNWRRLAATVGWSSSAHESSKRPNKVIDGEDSACKTSSARTKSDESRQFESAVFGVHLKQAADVWEYEVAWNRVEKLSEGENNQPKRRHHSRIATGRYQEKDAAWSCCWPTRHLVDCEITWKGRALGPKFCRAFWEDQILIWRLNFVHACWVG